MRSVSIRYHRFLVYVVIVIISGWFDSIDASWTSRQTHNLQLPLDYNEQTDLLCHVFLECSSKHDGAGTHRTHIDTKYDCKPVESISGGVITYSPTEGLHQIEFPEDIRLSNTVALVNGNWFVIIRNGKQDLLALTLTSSSTSDSTSNTTVTTTNTNTTSSIALRPARESIITIPVVSSGATTTTAGVSSSDSSSTAAAATAVPVAAVITTRATAQTDYRSTLVVRVTTADSEPTLDAEEMYAILFNLTAPSLATQFSWCSHGKTVFQPTGYGVLDVTVDANAAGSEADAIAIAAYTAARNLLGGVPLEQQFDHVMFCIPPGTNGHWIAYASINYWRTVYNDQWCTYLSGYMHELGHNVGFYHSNIGDKAYADYTGYMSAGYSQNTWPQKCYNGQNNWLMGWFQDRALDLPLLAPRIYKLATFVDYGKTYDDEVVLIRVDQALYLQYNRAKDFNIDTQQAINQVSVTEYIPVVFPGTDYKAGLDNSTGPFQVTINGTNATVVIDVCQFIAGNATHADVAVVSVGAGFSLCYRYKQHQVTISPISPTYLQNPSQSPIYFQPSPDIDENFPTITWDGERTPRLHKKRKFPLNLTRFKKDNSSGRTTRGTATTITTLGGMLLLLSTMMLTEISSLFL